MKTIYTVYQLNEKVNKLGNPYIGFTDNLVRRSKQWKSALKLDYVPELISLYTDTSAQRAFDWEQDKRVENGWRRERPLRHLRTITKKAHIALQKSEKAKLNNIKQGKKHGNMLKDIPNYFNTIGKKSGKKKATVTEIIVNEIKNDYSLNKKNYKELAAYYNITYPVIRRIIKGRNGKEYTNFKD